MPVNSAFLLLFSFLLCWTWYFSAFALLLIIICYCCCSVMSDSLQTYGLQHVRLPCPFIDNSSVFCCKNKRIFARFMFSMSARRSATCLYKSGVKVATMPKTMIASSSSEPFCSGVIPLRGGASLCFYYIFYI